MGNNAQQETAPVEELSPGRRYALETVARMKEAHDKRYEVAQASGEQAVAATAEVTPPITSTFTPEIRYLYE
jgi:hypothetical protein